MLRGDRMPLLCVLLQAAVTVAWCFSDAETGPGAGLASQPNGDRFKIEGRAIVPGVKSQDWVSAARVLVEGEEYVGFLRTDGSFAVNDVPSGSYVVEVVTPTYRFEPVRVDITSKGKMRARLVNYIKTSEVIRQPYPLQIRANGAHSYFMKRETWGWTDFLMNPMVMMMVLPLLIIVLLPKVVNTNDPEMRKEMEQSMNMLNPNPELPDVSELMTKLFSGSKGSSKAGSSSKGTRPAAKRRPIFSVTPGTVTPRCHLLNRPAAADSDGGETEQGQGGGWRRGGRGGHDGDGQGGEHRGRGRGGHHRGRGRKDHHRGRGRGTGRPADFHHRDRDEEENFQEEDGREEVFSRRKLESNWDRYKEPEKQGPDDDLPTQRGTDYHVLLESAGDSFTQFRFSEEKDWEMDSFTASQMSAVVVDLPALAQTLQELPLHQRLNLEAELLQVLTPVELPTASPAPKQEPSKVSTFAPASVTLKGLSIGHTPPAAAKPTSRANAAPPPPPHDDGDEELEQLLGLQKAAVGNPSASVPEESEGPEEACEEMKEVVPEVLEEKMEEVKDKDVTPLKAESVKQEMTEEDLEDWLDSMIS